VRDLKPSHHSLGARRHGVDHPSQVLESIGSITISSDFTSKRNDLMGA
jgi:hypothetical protein